MATIILLIIIGVSIFFYLKYKEKKEEEDRSRRYRAMENPVKLIYDNTKLKPWCVEKFDGQRYVQVTGWFAKEENAREVYNRLVRETSSSNSNYLSNSSSQQKLLGINKTNATVNYVDKDDKVLWSTKYDSKGKMKKETTYNDDGSISFTDEFDSNTGDVIKHTSYDNGRISLIKEFYPSSGEMKKTTFYEPDGSISSVNEYDLNTGNTVKTLYYENGKVSHWDEFKYDSKTNDMTVMIEHERDGKITQSEFDPESGEVNRMLVYNADGTLEKQI